MQNHKLKFKIGCDPEFAFLAGDRAMDAEQINDITNYFKMTKFGEAEIDGSGGPAEIRPNPSNVIPKVATNIKGILTHIAKKAGMFIWSTKSKSMPVGGHIHLELPESFSSEGSDEAEQYMLKMMSFYLPLLMCEDPENYKNRIRGGYGEYGDYRIGRPDDARTYELRTPSAEWLTCPKTAIATFAYIATIHHEILHRPESFDKTGIKHLLFKNKTQMTELEKLTKSNYAPLIDQMLKKIRSCIRTFELYPTFRYEISWLFNYEKVRAEKAKYNYDIMKGWNLKTPQITLKKLLAKNKRTIIDEYEEDDLEELHLFSYNDDTNMRRFIEELTKKIFKTGWKLKHNYAFFGLKSSIKKAIVADQNLNVILGQDQLKLADVGTDIKSSLARMKGKYWNKKDNILLVGIPFKMRAEMNTNPFFALMHYLEYKIPEGNITPAILKKLSGITVDNIPTIKKKKQVLNIPEVRMPVSPSYFYYGKNN